MPRHTATDRVPYTASQMFALVADIERYPEFLPWVRAVRLRRESATVLVAEMVVGFRGVTERYTSRVTLDETAKHIDVTYEDGPFKSLKNKWIFRDDPSGCVIDFDLAFEMRSRLLQGLLGAVFMEAVRKMTVAFRRRADALYGGGARVQTLT